MARVWWDGFDEQAADNSQYVYAVPQAYVAGRIGGSAVLFNHQNRGLIRAVTAQDRYSVGVAFKAVSTYGVSDALDSVPGVAGLGYGTPDITTLTTHCFVGVTSLGEIRLHGGGGSTLYTSPAGTVIVNAWHYLCFGCIVHDSAGQAFLSLDGELLYSGTGLDTRTGLGSNIEFACIGHGNSGNIGNRENDDWYIEDTYDVNLPERRVETLVPNGDSTPLDWVPSTGSTHYTMVNELGFSDADYLSGSFVDDKDMMTLGDLSTIPEEIDGVMVFGRGYKTDAITRKLNYGLKSGAVEVNGPDHTLLGSATGGTNVNLTDPNTGVAWTGLGVNAALVYPRIAV